MLRSGLLALSRKRHFFKNSLYSVHVLYYKYYTILLSVVLQVYAWKRNKHKIQANGKPSPFFEVG